MVARQLGHANPTMVLKVYGRFVPNTVDLVRWESIAAKQDAEAFAAAQMPSARPTQHPKENDEFVTAATIPATKLAVVRGGQYAKRHANPKAHTALAETGAGGLEPPTSALTVRRSAD